jgi:hypothetical protein
MGDILGTGRGIAEYAGRAEGVKAWEGVGNAGGDGRGAGIATGRAATGRGGEASTTATEEEVLDGDASTTIGFLFSAQMTAKNA